MVGTSNKSVSEMAIDLRLQPIFTYLDDPENWNCIWLTKGVYQLI